MWETDVDPPRAHSLESYAKSLGSSPSMLAAALGSKPQAVTKGPPSPPVLPKVAMGGPLAGVQVDP